MARRGAYTENKNSKNTCIIHKTPALGGQSGIMKMLNSKVPISSDEEEDTIVLHPCLKS
jgi:hypothetical protein